MPRPRDPKVCKICGRPVAPASSGWLHLQTEPDGRAIDADAYARRCWTCRNTRCGIAPDVCPNCGGLMLLANYDHPAEPVSPAEYAQQNFTGPPDPHRGPESDRR